jgi:hypothetical protein
MIERDGRRTAMQRIKETFRKMKRKQELWCMDVFWYITGQSSWSLFPPSFYATHTPDEARRAEKETIESYRQLLDELY